MELINKISSEINFLKEVQEEYSGLTIECIIRQLESRLDYLSR
jgi:hypothetical protein